MSNKEELVQVAHELVRDGSRAGKKGTFQLRTSDGISGVAVRYDNGGVLNMRLVENLPTSRNGIRTHLGSTPDGV